MRRDGFYERLRRGEKPKLQTNPGITNNKVLAKVDPVPNALHTAFTH